MTVELTALTLAALLQVVHFAFISVRANLELGTGKTLSPRDKDRMPQTLEQQVKPKTARLFRAFNNHFESLILFAIAAVILTVTDQTTLLTAICAWTYLAARVLYIPAYYFGLVPWRSFIWMAAYLSIIVMLVAALL